jgi:cytochrome oxidase Cu insertion factor (SCO1/SenC/PrrC family)
MDHSSLFYLMDGNNQFVHHFDHAQTPAKMAEGLAQLIP